MMLIEREKKKKSISQIEKQKILLCFYSSIDLILNENEMKAGLDET